MSLRAGKYLKVKVNQELEFEKDDLMHFTSFFSFRRYGNLEEEELGKQEIKLCKLWN